MATIFLWFFKGGDNFMTLELTFVVNFIPIRVL